MPYINNRLRASIDKHLDLAKDTIISSGDLTYAITRIVHNYLQAHGDISYEHINKAVGSLECAKLELYRQIANPYEDSKKEENGNISALDIV